MAGRLVPLRARARSSSFSNLSFTNALCRDRLIPDVPAVGRSEASPGPCKARFRHGFVSNDSRYGTAGFPAVSLKLLNFCEFSQITYVLPGSSFTGITQVRRSFS